MLNVFMKNKEFWQILGFLIHKELNPPLVKIVLRSMVKWKYFGAANRGLIELICNEMPLLRFSLTEWGDF